MNELQNYSVIAKRHFGKLSRETVAILKPLLIKAEVIVLVCSFQLFSHVEFSKTLRIHTSNESCALLMRGILLMRGLGSGS